MSSFILVLSFLLILALNYAVCITANIKVRIVNFFIGSQIIYFCYLFSYILCLDVLVIVITMIACLYNSFFYTNYVLTYKNILIFFIYLAYILFVEGLKFEINTLFNGAEQGFKNLLTILFAIVLLMFISIIFKFCIRKVRVASYLYECKLVINKKVFYLELFLDSGNFIKYGDSDIPVVIVSNKKLMTVILKNSVIDEVDVCGAGEDGYRLKIILPTSFAINVRGRWISKKVAVGITSKDFLFYDGLMGLECVN